MSAQTGSPTIPPAPPSSRRIDRARLNLSRFSHDPNPVWMRELRQSARLTRTPVILAVLTATMTLLMATIGGTVSLSTEPATVGVVLFHTFFSVAFFVVTLVAPAVAASTIASERAGRTWEALLLTSVGSGAIARGKFLAAFTYIGLYVVMLVPVGGLSFVFGGVTAIEVLSAFALLALFAALSVAFGLSISSTFQSPVVAVVVTLLVAFPLSILGYVILGPVLSAVAHDQWPSVPEGPPVWMPTAFARAEFGFEYFLYLVAIPLGATILPAWFFYAVTTANLGSPSDDNSSALRQWMLVSIPLVAGVATVPMVAWSTKAWTAGALGLTMTGLTLIFVTFVAAGEPLGPSRRVLVHWERIRASAIRRFLGPGVMRAATLILALGTTVLTAQTVAAHGWLVFAEPPGGSLTNALARVDSWGLYLTGFTAFCVGFMAYTRSRAKAATVPRLLLLGALILAAIGPWVVMAIAGVLTHDDASDAFAALSPTFVPFVLFDRVGRRPELVMLAAVCAVGWGVLGLGLFGAASLRARRVVREHRAALARMEAMLAAEEQGIGAETPPPSVPGTRVLNGATG
ncbi:MAG: ABC transporter permease [Polyangiaceae bacterium]|nr:ABC transporter permease [Polyangiaceae bacterium]